MFPKKGTVSFNSITCDNNATASFDTTNWQINVSNLTQKGTKCDVHFKELMNAKDTILANSPTVLTRDDFSVTVENTTTGTIYKSLDESQYDNDGEVYYFAGNPTDNWLYFGGYYWRIVRINGDGSTRLIYSGTEESKSAGQILNSAFNSLYEAYGYSVGVGFTYLVGSQTPETQNGGKASTIKTALDTWYDNNLKAYDYMIATESGFCNDRNMASGYEWEARPSEEIFYAAYGRLNTNKSPSLKCNNIYNLYTTKIGLITADEVAFAGGVAGLKNGNYYLYTGKDYWTISPCNSARSSDYVYRILSDGGLGNWSVNDSLGVRPVINLSADVTLSGSGTSTDPYVVEGAA